MKRLRLLGGIAVALVAAVAALPFLISAEQFRPAIESRLQAAVGRPVSFGALSLHLMPLSLQAAGLELKGLATVEQLDIHVRLLPLLQGNVDVESLVLTRPVVTYTPAPETPGSAKTAPPKLDFVRIIDGKLRVSGAEYAHIDAELRTSGDQLTGSASWENGKLPVKLAFAAVRAGDVFTFSKLDASMGQVTAGFTGAIDIGGNPTVDGRLQIKPSPLTGLPIQSAYKPKGTLTADVKISGPIKDPVLNGAVQIADLEVSGGKLTQTLKSSALGLAITPTKLIASPFTLQVGPTVVQASFQLSNNYKTVDATISTKDASLQDLLVIGQVDDVTATGTATLQLRATGPLANPALSGSGSLNNADIHTPAMTPHLKLDTAQVKFEADSASLENATFHLGKTNGQGTVKVRNFKQPQIQISLKADQLSNTEMQAWFPPSKGESKPVTVSGDLAVGRMQLNDLVLEGVKTNLSLKDQFLTLDQLSAGVYGGRMTGSATVNLKAQPAVFNLKTHMEKIESEQLLAATTPLRKVIKGPLTADVQLQFAPKPGEDFARTLDGTLQFQLAQGQLIPVNLLGEMGALAKFLKPLNAATNTSVLGMKGQFNLKNGAAETSDLRVELDRAAALFTGSLNLVDQSLNLRMLTTLNKQFSEEVGGSKIGGFLSAAISSPKGELMMPSLVRGTFSKPIFTPDAATMGKMKLSSPANIQDSVKGVMDLFKPKQQKP